MKLKIPTEPSKVFFTSDLHFNHENIIKYCDRPFNNEDEMNEMLIENYNKTVPYNGTCFILGDLSCCSKTKKEKLIYQIHRLNGDKHLILGNHDYYDDEFYLDYCGFKSVSHYLEVIVDKQLIILSHYPMLTWNHINNNSWMLYGHVHGTFNRVKDSVDKYISPLNEFVGKKTMDVGVDNNPNYSPYSYYEIKSLMDKL